MCKQSYDAVQYGYDDNGGLPERKKEKGEVM